MNKITNSVVKVSGGAVGLTQNLTDFKQVLKFKEQFLIVSSKVFQRKETSTAMFYITINDFGNPFLDHLKIL